MPRLSLNSLNHLGNGGGKKCKGLQHFVFRCNIKCCQFLLLARTLLQVARCCIWRTCADAIFVQVSQAFWGKKRGFRQTAKTAGLVEQTKQFFHSNLAKGYKICNCTSVLLLLLVPRECLKKFQRTVLLPCGLSLGTISAIHKKCAPNQNPQISALMKGTVHWFDFKNTFKCFDISTWITLGKYINTAQAINNKKKTANTLFYFRRYTSLKDIGLSLK